MGDWYDIGPGEPGESKLTSLGVTATAIYYNDLTTLQEVARLLNKTEDAAAFEWLARATRKAFNAKFYNALTHVYDRGSQTDYAMPLALGIVPEADRAVVLVKLVEEIRGHGNHVTAGDIGFHFVVSALLKAGRADVLCDMLSRTDAPSYGYQLAMGASTLTEAWDANPNHSQDHFMLGHAEEWFYRGLAGLDFDLSREAGERIVIRPTPAGSVMSAEASYNSVIGRIVVAWGRESGMFSLNVTVPPNGTATVYIPAASPESITESGKAVRETTGLSFVRKESQYVVYRAQSGMYRFVVRE